MRIFAKIKNAMEKEKYIVWVDDNYHYMDKNYRKKAGEYGTKEEAIEVCRKIVETFFNGINPKEVTSAEELFSGYKQYGEDPFIESGGFSAWNYAKELCEKLSAKITQKQPHKRNLKEYLKNISKNLCQH
jgi:hypothetical protein